MRPYVSVPAFKVDQLEKGSALRVSTLRAPRVVAEPWPDDEQLAERLASGDVRAREILYRKYVEHVWGLALRLMGNRSEAEDIVQDTFMEAFRDVGQLRERAAIRAWLLRVTVHQAHRRFRRRRLLRVLGLDRGTEVEQLDKLAAASAPADVVLELGLLQRVLAELPANQRVAWSLRVVEGYSLDDVARLCECSLATAKRRISAAQARIGQHIEIEVADEDA